MAQVAGLQAQVAQPFITLDKNSRAAVEDEAARVVSLWPDMAQVSVEWED